MLAVRAIPLLPSVVLLFAGCLPGDGRALPTEPPDTLPKGPDLTSPTVEKFIALGLFRDSPNFQLLFVSVDGEQVQKVFPREVRGHEYTLSPDGQRIAFLQHSADSDTYDLYVVNSDGTGERRITDTPEWSEENPAWSPSGERIIVSRMPPSNVSTYSTDLFVIDVATGKERQITSFSPGLESHGQWSPDGERIYFLASHNYRDSGIWSVAPDGSGARPFLRGSFRKFVFSPDGQTVTATLSIHRNATGQPLNEPGVVIAKADGTEVRRFRPPVESGVVRSPDGLHFAGIDNESGSDRRGIVVFDSDGNVTRVIEGTFLRLSWWFPR